MKTIAARPRVDRGAERRNAAAAFVRPTSSKSLGNYEIECPNTFQVVLGAAGSY